MNLVLKIYILLNRYIAKMKTSKKSKWSIAMFIIGLVLILLGLAMFIVGNSAIKAKIINVNIIVKFYTLHA